MKAKALFDTHDGDFAYLQVRGDASLMGFDSASVEILTEPRTVPAGCLVISPPLEKWCVKAAERGEYIGRTVKTSNGTPFHYVANNPITGRPILVSMDGMPHVEFKSNGFHRTDDCAPNFTHVMPEGWKPGEQ